MMVLLQTVRSAVITVFLVGSVSVLANVEKVIFTAPAPWFIPSFVPNFDQLNLDVLSPARSTLPTQIAVRFPSDVQPRGATSWFLLEDLDEGHRYELRVCWAATQPTTFWLDIHTIASVWGTTSLISSLADYSKHRRAVQAEVPFHRPEDSRNSSILFLSIHSAADFYTTNTKLMKDPPPVEVDIILDPYVLNIFPQSLIPTAIYIAVLACVAWFLSGDIWTWLQAISAPASGTHRD